MVTLGGLVRSITHLVVQSYNDKWARRLRFVSFLGATVVVEQVLVIFNSGGARNADLRLMHFGANLWLGTYILTWLRVIFVFVWTPMAEARRREKAHAITFAPSGHGGGDSRGRPPPPSSP